MASYGEPMNDIIASVGVFLLLVAYFMNQFGMLEPGSRTYQGLNAVGIRRAGISAEARKELKQAHRLL